MPDPSIQPVNVGVWWTALWISVGPSQLTNEELATEAPVDRGVPQRDAKKADDMVKSQAQLERHQALLELLLELLQLRHQALLELQPGAAQAAAGAPPGAAGAPQGQMRSMLS